LAYVARDGTPRNIPIIFAWNGSQMVTCTPKNAPKLQALSESPMVALTIDTEVHPPKILLIRGRAELDFVDGIPDEYLQATSTYEMTPEQRVERENSPSPQHQATRANARCRPAPLRQSSSRIHGSRYGLRGRYGGFPSLQRRITDPSRNSPIVVRTGRRKGLVPGSMRARRPRKLP
jgi:hypothetical protein